MTRRRLPRAVVVLALAALAGLVAASCGVPLDDEPRAIARTTTTQTTVAPAEGGDGALTVYFFRGDRLEDVEVAGDADPDVRDAVTAVLAGPPKPYTTQIPTGTELRDFQLDGQTAIIDLSDQMEVIDGPSQKAAYAQLVYTALQTGEARTVRFLVGGEERQAPTDNGNLDVVDEGDYEPPLNPR